jgi:hypothetical protein
MEDRYAFSELIFDKDKIKKLIEKKLTSKSENESNTITLIIMGHGRERYKENFKKIIEVDKSSYSEPFIYKVEQQKKVNSVRIMSKAGKPKICAWDYKLCTKSMSSQDLILELSHIFFSKENLEINTLSIMNGLSLYFKKLYPEIINKIARNYQDLPEEKNPGSPDAEGYNERYEHFNQVLQSLEEERFSDLKALNHEKIFTIRPENEEEYNLPCEKYLFEIVELRIEESNELTNFINDFLKIRSNLVKNYYSMTKSELQNYLINYTNTIHKIYSLDISDYEKYYLIKFIFNLYFGNEISLSEIVEFFVLLGIETINIIDNTCRVNEDSRKLVYSKTPRTSEIEEEEQIKLSKSSSSKSRHNLKTLVGGNQKKKTRKIKY